MEAYQLTPADYLDSAIFIAEQETVFQRCWHLVGLARDLPKTDDWRLVKIAGVEVILQNVGEGEIRGFTNSCPHRFSAIRTESSGHGALRCPYHMWAFDREGLASVVPLRGDVPLDSCRADALRLDRWKIGRCGELLFAAHHPDRSLEQFLGSLMEPLSVIAMCLGDEVKKFEQDIGANWKIILQNTVEFDHALSVHKKTFAPMMTRNAAPLPYEASPPHISYLMPMAVPRSDKPIVQRIESIFERSLLPPHKGYAHWTLFPLSTLGTAFNHQVALIMYEPVAVNHTHATIRLFTPKFHELSDADKAILGAVIPADIAFSLQLLDEDKRICEAVQRGLSNAPAGQRGCLMPGDKLVGQWQSFWLETMGRVEL